MTPTVTIDVHSEGELPYPSGTVVVAVDVIRATTTITTVVSQGRRCFPVASWHAANRLAGQLQKPLLAGELSGEVPYGFELNNSPYELARRTDIARPLILLSSSGTKLIEHARQCEAVYIACFRNFIPVAREVAKEHSRVAVVGAASRGEFREEDQMCCAWIARYLLENRFAAGNAQTLALVKQWQDAPVERIMESASADFLIRTGQTRDLEFILSHVSDVDDAHVLEGQEVVTTGGRITQFVPIQKGPRELPLRRPIA